MANPVLRQWPTFKRLGIIYLVPGKSANVTLFGMVKITSKGYVVSDLQRTIGDTSWSFWITWYRKNKVWTFYSIVRVSAAFGGSLSAKKIQCRINRVTPKTRPMSGRVAFLEGKWDLQKIQGNLGWWNITPFGQIHGEIPFQSPFFWKNLI